MIRLNNNKYLEKCNAHSHTRTHNKYVIVIVHSRRIASMDNEICRHGKAEFTHPNVMRCFRSRRPIRFGFMIVLHMCGLRWNIVNVQTQFHLLIQCFMKNIFQINNASWYRRHMSQSLHYPSFMHHMQTIHQYRMEIKIENWMKHGWNGEIAWNVVHTHFHVLMY